MRFVRPVGAAAVVESADSFADRDNFDDTESVVDDVEDEEHVIRAGDPPGRSGVQRDERKFQILTDPRMPTKAEIDEHELSHVPYRNWCPHCVMGSGKDLDHRKGIEEERGLSEFSFDYCFLGDELGYKLTILVGRERSTGMRMATAVPTKGTTGVFSTDKVVEFIDECGCQHADIIVKTDQEPAIESLIKDVKESRGGQRTLVEESPVQSHGSNGIVERAVQAIEGLIRTMKSALEARLQGAIKADSPIVTFMAEYASYLLNRLEVGKDGKTAYERTKGKRATILGVEFGEKVMWKKRAKPKMQKLDPKWDFGILIGVRRRSGELLEVSPEASV